MRGCIRKADWETSIFTQNSYMRDYICNDSCIGRPIIGFNIAVCDYINKLLTYRRNIPMSIAFVEVI